MHYSNYDGQKAKTYQKKSKISKKIKNIAKNPVKYPKTPLKLIILDTNGDFDYKIISDLP